MYKISAITDHAPLNSFVITASNVILVLSTCTFIPRYLTGKYKDVLECAELIYEKPMEAACVSEEKRR